MNIGYFADGPWAHRALDQLSRSSSLRVVFICVRYDSQDSILIDYAKRLSIPLLAHPNVNSEEFLASVDHFGCDLFVSLSFNQIFKPIFLSKARLGTINCHAGKLPFYRGRNILNWALINDEREFGITVHYVDPGVDTGDIIVQRCFPITDDDDYGSLLEVAHRECANVLVEAINLIAAGKVVRTKQSDIHPVGLYCCQRKPGDEVIKWSQTSRELFNFIRALAAPGPLARTTLGGQPVYIRSARMIPDAVVYKGVPGQIVSRSLEELTVKTLDTTLTITEWDSDLRLRVGDRFE